MTFRRDRLHGSAVEVAGRGLLILGMSGAGKSRLALDLIGIGAGLIADDQVDLVRREDQVILSAPEPIRGMIEARGLGLLRCPAVGPVPLHAVLDLDTLEESRLPEPAHRQVMGLSFPLIRTPEAGHSGAALKLLLTYGLAT